MRRPLSPARFGLEHLAAAATLAALALAGCTPQQVPQTPGVACGPRRCTDRAPVCCLQLTASSLTSSCTDPRFECPSSRYECDEAADCGSMRLCCLSQRVSVGGVSSSTICRATCDSGETEVCIVGSYSCSSGAPCCQVSADLALCAAAGATCPGGADGGTSAPDAPGG